MIKRLWLFSLILVTGILLVVAGCSGGRPGTGTLEGKVTIGPIYPVEKPGEPRPTPCEVYQARKIMVYDADKVNLVKQVDIDCAGLYRVELNAGTYTVDINRIGIDRSGEVPQKIEIKAGETVKLNIDIDTGIR